jgi:F-type H+-transporting ATPase subunit epsilon
MKLDVVTPEGAKIRDLEVAAITLPGALGEMGILPGHVPLMAAMAVGPMTIETAGGPRTYAVANGYVEVLEDAVHVLAEACEAADEIDVERAKAKIEEMTRRLPEIPPVEGAAYEVALNSLRKAETRVQIAGARSR